jgi:hypothetical protein
MVWRDLVSGQGCAPSGESSAQGSSRNALSSFMNGMGDNAKRQVFNRHSVLCRSPVEFGSSLAQEELRDLQRGGPMEATHAMGMLGLGHNRHLECAFDHQQLHCYTHRTRTRCLQV